MKKTVLLLFILLLTFGCQFTVPQWKPVLEDEGELLGYLNPLPQEASRLTFVIDEIAAIRKNGERIPLILRINHIEGAKENRQRLIAYGALPPDSYSGISMKIKSASLQEQETITLDVPLEPVNVDFSFTIEKQRGLLFTLDLNYKKSIQGLSGFYPFLTAALPAKPISSLTGFISNYRSRTIMLFDRRSGMVTGIIELNGNPTGMALNQAAQKLYAALPSNDEIAVIDVNAGEVTNRIRLNVGDSPWELALIPDGTILLSANRKSNTVSFVDTSSYLETERVSVGKEPRSILIDREGKRAYVFNTLSNTVSVLDIQGRRVLTTITTDSAPFRGQFNTRQDKLYIIHDLSSYVLVIDTHTLSTAGRYFVGMGMQSIQVDQNSDLIYLGGKNDSFLGVYDPFSLTMIESIKTGGAILYSIVDGTENNILMVCPAKSELIISNLTSRKILSRIDTGEEPYWVSVMGERRF